MAEPFRKGYSNLSQQLDSFSKYAHNAGVDAKGWLTDNFNKAKIKKGWKEIESYLSSWYQTGKGFVEGASTTIPNFFKDWESNREKMHVIFKALGNTFPIIGSLLGSFQSEGESTLKMFFDAINQPKFKDFMSAASTLVSNNPNLLSDLEMKDWTDIIFAFNQDPETVTNTLQELNKQEDKKVDKDKLLSALKLHSLMGRANSLKKKAEQVIQLKDKSQAEAIIKEILGIKKELEAVIKANSEAQSQQ
ncbi:hypothetical protein MHF_0595 [Mycoplasma haemofelis Ohio2]|uniref:Uncharacterized protein n=1 Tax=Mycoplasma haemofelis (strain Ohio2) TaxID=859194 RepID=F6FI19_MYCHI|nr:hypothetical protein MHF_0595 [Mycoplasma haemofelis Ohio2]